MKQKFDALTDLVEHVAKIDPKTLKKQTEGKQVVVNDEGEEIILAEKKKQAFFPKQKGLPDIF